MTSSESFVIRGARVVDGTGSPAVVADVSVHGDRIAEARAAWRALADRDDVERRYWKQNDQGRWEQAA